MEIKQYLNIFKRWVWFLILGLIVGSGLGYFLSLRQAPVYQAESRFIILTAAPTSEFQMYFNYIDSAQLILTYMELLSADSTIEQASQELGFRISAGQAKAERVGETQFIRLVVKNNDPEKAAAIANGLVKILIEQNEELQSIRYVTTEQNLQNRISQAEQQIASIQQQINDMSTAYVQENLSEVTAQIDTLQNEINILENNIDEFNPYAMTDEEEAQMVEYQDQLDQLKPVLELYREIYTNLVVLGRGVEGGMSETTQLSQLQFTLDLFQQIYISSMASLESLQLSRAQSIPNVVQTEPAKVPSQPISPKPMHTAALAGVVGLLITGGLAFLIEYLDDTVKTPDEVKQLTGLPVIGYVSELQSRSKKKDQNGKYLFVSEQPRSAVTEALRSLRTNLEYSAVDHPAKTIAITSVNPEEGKSTIASNLALTIAQSGKKTLLLDADMRRPNVHSFFGIYNRVGLSDLLRNNLQFDQIVKPHGSSPNLHIITSGSLPPNPAELLGSKKMKTLLETFKQDFDMIIMDTSPMVVADPQILATRCDGVIFIVQPGMTRSNHLSSSIQQLEHINARILGIVFNRIPRRRNAYYNGYYYSYHYSKDKNEYFGQDNAGNENMSLKNGT
ncbi:MAG: polysaccharide biosynthesis tyrosine autokinase [Brevefilum sp.]|nr:polysaccharide biosynthesis tyrosine autokinase [Brevefilum sp.]